MAKERKHYMDRVLRDEKPAKTAPKKPKEYKPAGTKVKKPKVKMKVSSVNPSVE
jgi:hypothetical protein